MVLLILIPLLSPNSSKGGVGVIFQNTRSLKFIPAHFTRHTIVFSCFCISLISLNLLICTNCTLLCDCEDNSIALRFEVSKVDSCRWASKLLQRLLVLQQSRRCAITGIIAGGRLVRSVTASSRCYYNIFLSFSAAFLTLVLFLLMF